MERENEKSKDKKAVLLLNLGSPENLSDIKRFLYELFSDGDIIKIPFSNFLQKPFAFFISSIRAKKAAENYKKIGGRSPLVEITGKQAMALEKKLKENNYNSTVLPAMKYSRPKIGDAVEKILRDKVSAGDWIKEIIALPLYPQYSFSTTQASFNEIERCLGEKGIEEEVKVKYVMWWYDNEKYINALAERTLKVLKGLNNEAKGSIALVFSAHSLPERSIKEGDPYKKQIEETAERVYEIIKNKVDKINIDYFISYQSEIRFMRWLEPRTSEIIRRVRKDGYNTLLIVPVSFVSDNIETLYEIDIFYRNLAESLGLKFSRVPCFNYDSDFINVLFDIVIRNW